MIKNIQLNRPKHLRELFVSALMIAISLTQAIALPVAQAAPTQADLDAMYNWPLYNPNATQSCSGSSGVPTLVGGDPETQIWNYFKGQGLSDEQTAGVMGNIQQESSFDPQRIQGGGDSPDPHAAGGGGWGLVQWTPGAKVIKIEADNHITGDISELSTQLAVIWAEMKGTSPNGRHNMLATLKRTKDVDPATQVFLKDFEGGSDPITLYKGQPKGVREAFAETIFDKYSGNGNNNGNGGGVSYVCGGTVITGSCKVNKPVYDPEYSLDQFASIFGNPGSAASHPDLHLVDVTEWGFHTQVSPLVAGCLDATVKQINSLNLPYKVRLFGCYRFDSNNGSSNIGLHSYHTYGAACDINWDTNPYHGSSAGLPNSCSSYPPCDMPAEYVQAFYQHGFAGGGHFHSVKDYMHFEWHGVVPK